VVYSSYPLDIGWSNSNIHVQRRHALRNQRCSIRVLTSARQGNSTFFYLFFDARIVCIATSRKVFLLDSVQPKSDLYRRHAWPVRVMHWINVLVFFLMLMSGLMIFNAHPTLYWGEQSYADAPVVLHLEPAPGNFRHAIPSWMTIPGYYSLAKSRSWHLFFMWLFVANGLIFVLWTILSRHLKRDLWPSRRDMAGFGRAVVDHLRFHHPKGEAARRYNVLQKLVYLGVIFVLLPAMVVTGFAMSPGLNAVWPGWIEWLGGRQSARTIHFFVAWTLVAFLLVHVLLVATTGLWNNLRSMITGRYRIRLEAADAAETSHEG